MSHPMTSGASALVALSLLAACASAQQPPRPGGTGGPPPTRVHTETEAQPLTLAPATQNAGQSIVEMSARGATRVITANGIPDHLVGQFPNSGNPNAISSQNVSLNIPLNPTRASSPQGGAGWVFGVSLNGVVFDPFAAEFWQGDRNSGWNYDALGGAVALGLDENYAHVQPDGTYHYHGIPFDLLELHNYSANQHSPLIGYAADGYPIYAMTAVIDGQLTQVTPSYRLKSGNRPGGAEPSGRYDGAFVQDWEYVEGLGTLDACNGAFTRSPEYPNGTYAYFLTESWPVIPRCFMGVPSQDFRLGAN